MRVAWLIGGTCFAGIAVVCWYAKLDAFAVGAAIVGLVMFTESGLKDDK